MVPTQLPGPPCLYQEPNTHSNRVFRAPQRLSSTLKRCGDCPGRPTNTLGVRPEGPGRGNEEPPGTGNPHPGAAGLPGLPEATIIHPHRSPGEGSRGNPDSKALLPVRDGRRRSGQAAVGPSPCGHTRAGRKHGSPLSSGSRGDRSGSSNPARNAGMEPTGQRTHRLRDQPRGRPPAPATAQDHYQLQDHQAGPGAAAPGSAEPPERAGLPEPGGLTPRAPLARPSRRATWAARALPAGAAAAEYSHPRPRRYKGGGARGGGSGACLAEHRPSRATCASPAPPRPLPAPTSPAAGGLGRAPRHVPPRPLWAPGGGGGTGLGAGCAWRPGRMTLPGAAAARDFPEFVPRSDSAQEFHSLSRNRGSICHSLPGPHPSRGSCTRSREF